MRIYTFRTTVVTNHGIEYIFFKLSKNSGCLAFTKRSTEIIHLRHNQYVFIIKIQIFAPPGKKVVTKFQFSFFHRSENQG